MTSKVQGFKAPESCKQPEPKTNSASISGGRNWKNVTHNIAIGTLLIAAVSAVAAAVILTAPGSLPFVVSAFAFKAIVLGGAFSAVFSFVFAILSASLKDKQLTRSIEVKIEALNGKLEEIQKEKDQAAEDLADQKLKEKLKDIEIEKLQKELEEAKKAPQIADQKAPSEDYSELMSRATQRIEELEKSQKELMLTHFSEKLELTQAKDKALSRLQIVEPNYNRLMSELDKVNQKVEPLEQKLKKASPLIKQLKEERAELEKNLAETTEQLAFLLKDKIEKKELEELQRLELDVKNKVPGSPAKLKTKVKQLIEEFEKKNV